MRSSVPCAANVVVLAEAIATKRRTYGNSQPRSIIEEDVFRVILTFKGALKPEDLFPVPSEINLAGECGISARNSPVSIY
jgi:hypothetical protein